MKKVALSVVSVAFVSMMIIGATIDRPHAAPPGWTHSGCWTQFSGGTCYDIYTDSSGQHWKCKPCGETKKPNQNTCTAISQATLNSGRWCS
jgi:hypothetical protein